MDKASWGGVLLGLGGIVGGLLLEGGRLSQVLQPTAAMIVFGGTFGAVLIQFPLPIVAKSVRRLGHVFLQPKVDAPAMVKELARFANQARREGIISLDAELEKISDPFLRKSLMLAVDGTEPQELRSTMELEMDNQSEQEEKIPQVFESAGGFSPTIGIIGAVLGLIQVMQHLDKLDEVVLLGIALVNLVLILAGNVDGLVRINRRIDARANDLGDAAIEGHHRGGMILVAGDHFVIAGTHDMHRATRGIDFVLVTVGLRRDAQIDGALRQ